MKRASRGEAPRRSGMIIPNVAEPAGADAGVRGDAGVATGGRHGADGSGSGVDAAAGRASGCRVLRIQARCRVLLYRAGGIHDGGAGGALGDETCARPGGSLGGGEHSGSAVLSSDAAAVVFHRTDVSIDSFGAPGRLLPIAASGR